MRSPTACRQSDFGYALVVVVERGGVLGQERDHHVVGILTEVLDSLETIDSERIAALVEYFSEYTDYMMVALLPEDAAALDDDYRRVTEI